MSSLSRLPHVTWCLAADPLYRDQCLLAQGSPNAAKVYWPAPTAHGDWSTTCSLSVSEECRTTGLFEKVCNRMHTAVEEQSWPWTRNLLNASISPIIFYRSASSVLAASFEQPIGPDLSSRPGDLTAGSISGNAGARQQELSLNGWHGRAAAAAHR